MKFLEKTLKNSKAVDRESLCVTAGRLVWLLEIDLKLLAFNGNLTDNVFAAALLTLAACELPVVQVKGEGASERV